MNIAYRLSGLELLFHENAYHCFFPVVAKNSIEHEYAKHLCLKNIITINLKTDDLFSELSSDKMAEWSNLGEELRRLKVSHLLIRKSNASMKKWSKKYNIELLCPDYKLGEKIENKIYFDSFLRQYKIPKPESRIIQSEHDEKPFQKTVLQVPESFGGGGTFLVQSKKSFYKLSQKLPKPLLARKCEKGLSLSSSIFIDKKKIYFTAIERQCFIGDNKNSFGDFIGIQWIPHHFFEKKIYQKIEVFLLKTGQKLSSEKLQGLINIDFILNKAGDIFCIECNPRLACATNQIMAKQELRNNTDFIGLYLNSQEARKIKKETLPKSDFTGCQMFISFSAKTTFPHKVKDFIPSGFYVCEQEKLKKVGLKNRFDFNHLKNGLFYYNEIGKGDSYKTNLQIGTVVANFPLYSFKTGKMNKAGKCVYNYFINQNT